MSSPTSTFPIVFIGTQMEVAGAQKLMLSQARWFHTRGYSVKAIFFYDKQGLHTSWREESPFPVVNLNAWRYKGFFGSNFLRLLPGFLRLWPQLRGARAVITFTPHSNLLAIPLAWLVGVPARIATHHGYIEASSRLMARAHGWLTNSGMVSALVAVSKQVRDYAMARERAKLEKLVVIENGIEEPESKAMSAGERAKLRRSMGAAEDQIVLLTVGRFTIQKGHTVLLDAIAELDEASEGAHFAFAGTGPQQPRLERQARELGIQSRVSFLGLRDDVDQLLQAAHVFVQPSLWEGLSLALLEALFAGIPVLATEVEGTRDVLVDGETGLLVPPEDASALALVIRRLLNDEALRERLGAAGQAHARRHYSVDAMCKKYEQLILSILDQRDIAP